MPRVTVIVPTWNGAELLAGALASLRRQSYGPFEIVVVDNGSTDGTIERLSPLYPEIRWIALPENRGFAAAINAGIRATRGELVALLNNDAEADPRWLEALVSALDAHPEAGSCASKMLDFHDPERVDGAGDRMALQAAPIGRGERDGPAYSVPRHVFSASGGAALYRRALFDEVGLFDERYFAYLEDVDLGFRAQLAGYRCLYVPDAVVHHRGGATVRRVPESHLFWLVRNTLFLFFQNMPRAMLLRHGPFMLAWPWVHVLKEGQGIPLGRRLRTALRGWLAFWVDLPAVCRRRRRAYARRRISDGELRARLSPPAGWASEVRDPRSVESERCRASA